MRFRIKKIPVLKMPIGERLKRARRRKKLSLEKLEEITKVRKRYLEDIERNDYDNLPSDVYAKGFLFKYAEAVGLKSKEIIDHFKQERGLENMAEDEEEFSQKPIKTPKIIFTPRLIATLISIVLLIAFGTYIIFQIRNFAKAPELTIISPESEELKTNSSGLKIEGKTDPGASVFINEQPISVNLDGHFAEEVRLSEGINEVKISAKNKTQKETMKIVTASVKLPEIAKEATKTSAKKSLFLKIDISPNPVWLSVDIDGKRVFQGVMLKGTNQTFQAEREIIVNTGNAGSTNLTLNKTKLGILGKEGEVKKNLKYTIDMVK